MDPAAAAARRQADKWMSVAEKLLMAKDLEGCKEFSSQAIAADPRTPGAEDLYAAADVLPPPSPAPPPPAPARAVSTAKPAASSYQATAKSVASSYQATAVSTAESAATCYPATAASTTESAASSFPATRQSSDSTGGVWHIASVDVLDIVQGVLPYSPV
ncbi:hypothetical protein TRIUR3_11784 [Triticum urartu]|uniref:Uncharacterized protein n=1 Tax=Triticum urartu TaxID=4572 RepID=M7Z9B7_TRIUA|nr:hypothetical protein TRIUR3_11784 [Triticum urartu]